MSGGVDSSVAAVLLNKQGWEVSGFTITPFKVDENCRTNLHEKSCCSYKSTLDASDICRMLGIPHYLSDSTNDFQTEVVDNFVSEYLSGNTPNPCVICNPAIKWGSMISKADTLGIEYIATGHYSKIFFDENTEKYKIAKGLDHTKDQSYFLWRLTQKELARTRFPLGDLTKEETRRLAAEFSLPVADKPESQEICFIPDNDYRRFLKYAVSDIDKRIGEGDIIFEGKVIGKHQGYPFYTIGQRRGLGVTYKEPLFVKRIIPEQNVIEVGLEIDLLSSKLSAVNVNIIANGNLNEGAEYMVKIRYKDPGAKAFCKTDPKGNLIIEFEEPRRAVTPGQSVVLYSGEELIGGGIIFSAE